MSQKEDFGYEYTLTLCKAIEELTREEEKTKNNVFKYRGVNLRYAIERAFYFNYATDDFLLNIFAQWKTDKLPDNINVKDPLQKKLISLICKIPEKNITLRINVLDKIKKTLKIIIQRVIVAFGVNTVISFLRKTINSRAQKNTTADILFFVINERFVRFMKPIFDVLPTSHAYITHDQKTEKYIDKEKKSYVKISHLLYRIERWSKPESWLKRFYLLEYYDILYDTLERLRPKSVILVEGNAPPYEVVNQICKKLGIRCICIQQGWSPIVHNGFRNMTYSKMLVWGNGFARDLATGNPNQRLIATGSFVIEKIKDTKIPKKTGDKIKLGFFPPMKTKILSQEKLDEFMSLIQWAADEFKNTEIRVSQHPTIKKNEQLEKLSEHKNIKFLSSETHSLQEIMAGNDIAISFYSTTILESMAAGALPIMINLTSMPNYFPDIHKLGAGIEVRNIEEAKMILKDFVNHPEKITSFDTAMQKFREEYFSYNKETALENIIKEII